MSYIGKTPTVGNFQVCDAISVVNGQAAYTMQVDSVNVVPESANHMLVSLNGILQKPGSSFTVSGSTITFASNLSTGDVIDFITLLGNVLDLGTPSDATVTNAKTNFTSTSSAAGLQIKGDGTTDGTLQLNCSQNTHGVKIASPAHSAGQSYTLTLPTGNVTADKFLKVASVSGSGTTGIGQLSFADAGGGLVKLAETNISSGVSSVSFDGYFTSDYEIYKVFFQNLRPVGSGNYQPSIRFRRSNADVTGSSYYGAAQQAYNGGSNHNGDFGQTYINMVKDSSVKGNSDYGFSGEFTIYNPLQTTRYKMMSGFGTYLYSTDRWYVTQFGGVLKDNTTALSGFTFINNGGENFDDGNIYLFGFKTS